MICEKFQKSIYIDLQNPPQTCGFCDLLKFCNSPVAARHRAETGKKRLEITFSRAQRQTINSEGASLKS